MKKGGNTAQKGRKQQKDVRVRRTRPASGGRKDGRPIIRDSSAAVELVMALEDRREPVLLVLTLDRKLQLVARNEVKIGTVAEVLQAPRAVFTAAIRKGAYGVILACRDLDENMESTPEDFVLPRTLIAVGELLGIPVLDHFIVGDQSCMSLRDNVGAELPWRIPKDALEYLQPLAYVVPEPFEEEEEG